jgi:hypothetical protein|tara:strand:+ start:68 stop:247 length:180 start_codon:yes stop_codon:yes gene_type:complete
MKNGDMYQGEFKNGKANGKGVYLSKVGTLYKGEWKDDLYHGSGVERREKNTVVYTGQFV